MTPTEVRALLDIVAPLHAGGRNLSTVRWCSQECIRQGRSQLIVDEKVGLIVQHLQEGHKQAAGGGGGAANEQSKGHLTLEIVKCSDDALRGGSREWSRAKSPKDEEWLASVRRHLEQDHVSAALNNVVINKVPNFGAGQSGAFTTTMIDAHHCFGEFAGRLLERTDGGEPSAAFGHMKSAFQYEFQPVIVEGKKINLMVDPYPQWGNQAMAINSAYTYPKLKPVNTNASFVEIIVNGVPRCFVCANRKIQEGEELLVDSKCSLLYTHCVLCRTPPNLALHAPLSYRRTAPQLYQPTLSYLLATLLSLTFPLHGCPYRWVRRRTRCNGQR